ncbi:hypothetical protein [Micrococcus luteus]|uniref:hypothetical protein n=1 Tax=Micrococcus luteus TaxID=1270 RepID=UPI00332FE8C6
MHNNTGRLIRKTWTDLPAPATGPLVPLPDGSPCGVVTFGWGEELASATPSWWRDLAAAALATAHALEAELAPPPAAPAEEPAGPLGLRDAVVTRREPYADPTPTGTHPTLVARAEP